MIVGEIEMTCPLQLRDYFKLISIFQGVIGLMFFLLCLPSATAQTAQPNPTISPSDASQAKGSVNVILVRATRVKNEAEVFNFEPIKQVKLELSDVRNTRGGLMKSAATQFKQYFEVGDLFKVRIENQTGKRLYLKVYDKSAKEPMKLMVLKGYSFLRNRGEDDDVELQNGDSLETEVYRVTPPAGIETVTAIFATNPIRFKIDQATAATRTSIGLAETISNVGALFGPLGRYDIAVEFYERLLEAVQAEFDKDPDALRSPYFRETQLALINSLGLANHSISRFDKALDYYKKALSLAEQFGDKEAEASILSNLGLAYASLSQNKDAIEQYNRALVLQERSVNVKRDASSLTHLASTLNNLGVAYESLQEFEKAINFYERALRLYQEAKNPTGEGETFNNLGSSKRILCRQALGETSAGERQLRASSSELCDQGISHLKRALDIAKAVNNRANEGFAMNNLGVVYNLLNENRRAIDYFEQALVIHREVGNRASLGIALGNLMFAYKALAEPERAIFYGKQAINSFQELRGEIKALDKKFQTSFVGSRENAYRILADLLLSKGRFPEAEQVLTLLKEEEYFGLLRRSDDTTSEISYTSAELAAINILSKLAQLGRERGELVSLKEKKEIDETGNRRLMEIDRELLPVVNTEFNRALDAITRDSPGTVVKTAEVRDAQALMDKLAVMGPGTVALYTIISSENGQSTRGWIMLIMPPEFRKAYEIDVKELDKTVLNLRLALSSPARDPHLLAQKLYRILFQTPQPKEKGGTTLEADLETVLKNQKDRTLMWSLDGVLRYVPMTVLSPDGQHYLIERYRNVVFTPASIPTMSDAVGHDWRALGLGVSKEHKYKDELMRDQQMLALGGVPAELAAIVIEEGKQDPDGALPGIFKLNEQFNRKAMLDGLDEGYTVVHIASHFSYNSANPQKSFLLLGDGEHLEMSEFNNSKRIFNKTALLTLSACDTAMGSSKDVNGKDIEGLGFVAQRLGAQSVIASLWPVDDISTQVLMPEFYRLRQSTPDMTKAEALRRAQLSLLRGTFQEALSHKITKRAGIIGNPQGGTSAQPLFQPDPKAPYAHPYYWAPFILIGNWK